MGLVRAATSGTDPHTPTKSDLVGQGRAPGHAAHPASHARAGQRPFEKIPEEFIREADERADLLAIVRRSVELKPAGASSLVGLCPFHTERTPSFVVTPSKNLYKCFGCGAVGGSLRFLMEHDGMPFREAVQELAQMSGMALPAALAPDPSSPAPPPTAPLYEAMARAQKFFGHVLRHTPRAIDYLKQRGLTAQGLAKFAIGCAPDEWRGLQEAFGDYDSTDTLVQCGLVRERTNEQTGRVHRYDWFRNRITFGVRDSRGRIVAYGARVLDDSDPKYLNSPETPIFHKSGALFGLFEARDALRRKRRAIVVEGYMDVVMLHQHGIENAVACMGTAFTRDHAARLFALADTVVFSFDGDEAGKRAAWRALETVLPALEDGHDVRFLSLPAGVDPDELVQLEGAQAFELRVEQAPPLSRYLLSTLAQRHNDLASLEDRARFAAAATSLVQRIAWKSSLRRLLMQAIKQESGLPGSSLQLMESQSRTAPHSARSATLWTRLLDAIVLAPEAALAQRGLLLDLISADVPEEREVRDALSALAEREDPADPDIPVAPSTSTEAMLAAELLAAAADLILELREQQARDELRDQFHSGEIDEATYVREVLSLGSAGTSHQG